MSHRPLRIFYAAADAATSEVAASRIWYYNLYMPLCDLGHEVLRFDYEQAKRRDENIVELCGAIAGRNNKNEVVPQ